MDCQVAEIEHLNDSLCDNTRGATWVANSGQRGWLVNVRPRSARSEWRVAQRTPSGKSATCEHRLNGKQGWSENSSPKGVTIRVS